MENRREVKIIAIVALLVAVVGLSVAYAALSTSLSISGSAQVNAATWNVKFVKGSWAKTGTATATEPTVTATEISGFDVTLVKPGDKAVYTFTVTNAGSLDAKLASSTIGTLSCTGGADTTEATKTCAALSYTLKYADGTVPSVNDTLTHGQSKTLVLTVEFLSTADFVPSSAVTVNGVTASFQYVQA